MTSRQQQRKLLRDMQKASPDITKEEYLEAKHKVLRYELTPLANRLRDYIDSLDDFKLGELALKMAGAGILSLQGRNPAEVMPKTPLEQDSEMVAKMKAKANEAEQKKLKEQIDGKSV